MDLLNAFITLIVTIASVVLLVWVSVVFRDPMGKSTFLCSHAVTGKRLALPLRAMHLTYLFVDCVVEFLRSSVLAKRKCEGSAFVFGYGHHCWHLHLVVVAFCSPADALNIAEITARLPAVVESQRPYCVCVHALGFSIKLAVFPLYQWLPNAYAHHQRCLRSCPRLQQRFPMFCC